MTPLTYEIVLALADADRHGYGIIKEIEARSGPDAAPSTGALYLALQRMRGDGLIEQVEAGEVGGDARRRYYRLTVKGREDFSAACWTAEMLWLAQKAYWRLSASSKTPITNSPPAG